MYMYLAIFFLSSHYENSLGVSAQRINGFHNVRLGIPAANSRGIYNAF